MISVDHTSSTIEYRALIHPPHQQSNNSPNASKKKEAANNAHKQGIYDKFMMNHKKNNIRSSSNSHVLDMTELIEKAFEAAPDNASYEDVREVMMNICSSMIASHYEYDSLAASLFIESLYEKTEPSFSDSMRRLHRCGLIADDFIQVVNTHSSILDAAIVNERDNLLTFFGLKTLCNGYLLKDGSQIIERPQYLFMRVAVGIHLNDLTRVIQTYEFMSTKQMIHATPTLFNAGTKQPQNSSCFLLQIPTDSLDAIFSTLTNSGKISKHAGGIGLAIHNVRAKGSSIKSCNGTSSGIVPMLRMFNAASRYVNQAGKRNGSMAVYLEPWHADIEDFLELRKNYGNEEQRTRDLFTAMWVPDLFMKRVDEDGVWSLMSPDICTGLARVYGEEFDNLYQNYEQQKMYIKQVPARELWSKIMESQMETGMPYMLYKDHVNRKTNHQHLGTIQCSNLCTEIMEFTDQSEIAVCNLCSIGLPAFVDEEMRQFNFSKLHQVVRVATRNLDNVIDRNFYPVDGAKTSNLRHRPIGIGVQGLADVFAMLGMPFESDKAAELNEMIFETIYHAALVESLQLAKEKGKYSTFDQSPMSKGIFQFDMWEAQPCTTRYDWDGLRKDIMEHGIRNSLLVAPMPTASTSQILGYNECFEPFTSNLYKRNTLAGEFIVLNKHLVKALEQKGIWDDDMKNKIILHNGSVQSIPEIPSDIKTLFKTAWEIKQRAIIDMAATRGRYICQSQSMNLFMEDPDYTKLTAMHFYSWRKGLKTGMYYLRTRPKARAQQFTVDPSIAVCTRQNGCVVCSA